MAFPPLLFDEPVTRWRLLYALNLDMTERLQKIPVDIHTMLVWVFGNKMKVSYKKWVNTLYQYWLNVGQTSTILAYN